MDEKITLRCACGWETTGSEDAVVEATVEHGRRMHNMIPTRDEVIAMAVATSERQEIVVTEDRGGGS